MSRPVELPIKPLELEELEVVPELEVELAVVVTVFGVELTEFIPGVLSCGADA